MVGQSESMLDSEDWRFVVYVSLVYSWVKLLNFSNLRSSRFCQVDNNAEWHFLSHDTGWLRLWLWPPSWKVVVRKRRNGGRRIQHNNIKSTTKSWCSTKNKTIRLMVTWWIGIGNGRKWKYVHWRHAKLLFVTLLYNVLWFIQINFQCSTRRVHVH